MKNKLANNAKIPGNQEINTLAEKFNNGRYSEATILAGVMTEQFPMHPFAWKVLGALAMQSGRSAEALELMQRAAFLAPEDAEAHNNLGNAFQELGRLVEAEASLRQALRITPNYAAAHYNLGNVLKSIGQQAEAESSYRQALAVNPSLAEAYFNLGVVLHESGRSDAAEESCRHALQIRPDYSEALENLAQILNEQGKASLAWQTIKHSLRLRETEAAKTIFVAIVKRLHFTQDDDEARVAIVRALSEPWGRPSDLARVGIELVKLNRENGACIARAVNAWPMHLPAKELFGLNGLTTVASDLLLCTLLESAPICDIEMEYFLTLARSTLLEATTGIIASGDETDAALIFYCALARQCFINEYVFSLTDDESDRLNKLRDSLVEALANKTQVPIFWLVAVAAYIPLYSLPRAARLLDIRWPDAVTAVLKQQISEPEEEFQLRASIPKLTAIADEVSLLVQRQYEENPYPRWITAAPVGDAKNISGYLRRKFPLAAIDSYEHSERIEILIAGCGTGQHSIGTARLFKEAQLLAVDLSMSSLSYAKRKTQELGLTTIEYAQADLLKLGKLARSFDLIESVGVLHHLVEPWAGWTELLHLLRPGGFMKLGFYSEVARRNIVRIRTFITEQGYGSSPDEIRKCRQDLMLLGKHEDFGSALKSSDFYSTSACRDLLFHVQEKRMSLTTIGVFLKENNLELLGFEIDPVVLRAYKLRFPDDCAATNLDHWQTFENENPDSFFGMYQFWVQKNPEISECRKAV
jgi:tetratricopeptide (TPR) repeat protein/SAM-dependent methyltransferase